MNVPANICFTEQEDLSLQPRLRNDLIRLVESFGLKLTHNPCVFSCSAKRLYSQCRQTLNWRFASFLFGQSRSDSKRDSWVTPLLISYCLEFKLALTYLYRQTVHPY